MACCRRLGLPAPGRTCLNPPFLPHHVLHPVTTQAPGNFPGALPALPGRGHRPPQSRCPKERGRWCLGESPEGGGQGGWTKTRTYLCSGRPPRLWLPGGQKAQPKPAGWMGLPLGRAELAPSPPVARSPLGRAWRKAGASPAAAMWNPLSARAHSWPGGGVAGPGAWPAPRLAPGPHGRTPIAGRCVGLDPSPAPSSIGPCPPSSTAGSGRPCGKGPSCPGWGRRCGRT